MLTSQLVVAALLAGLVYALIATGLNLIYGTMRLLNVAHGELLMIGGYVAFWLLTLFGVGPLWSLAIAFGGMAGLGVLAYRCLFRQLISAGRLMERLEANSLLVFFGIAVILQNAAALTFSSNPRGYQYFEQILTMGGASITANRAMAFGVALACVIAVIVLFRGSMTGLAMRALMQSRDAAAVVGIDVDRTYMVSLGLGFGLAGVAGVVVSMYEPVSPFMGLPYTIAAFVIIILGGLGSLTGGLIGGLVLGILETFGVALVGTRFRSILVYGVFILILVLRPQGLLGGRRLAA